jgi:multidrug efflux pump subunit AcrA (membrane-fusion protein)
MSEELIIKVDQILNKVQLPDRHTFFQLEKFIIGKEPTAQSQLWQIIREMQARMETIDSYRQQLEEAEDALELFDIKIERQNRLLRQEASVESSDSDLNIKEYEINIRKLQRDKESLVLSSRKAVKKMQFVLEELAFLEESYNKIVKNYGEIKPMDDEEAQKEMWAEKLLEEFNLRVILSRPLEPEFIRTVMCLSDDAPVKKHVTKMLEVIQARMLLQNKKPEVETKAKITG